MKPPKFQHPLRRSDRRAAHHRHPPALFLRLRLPFVPFLSLSLFLFLGFSPFAPFCPRPGFLDTGGSASISSPVPFLPRSFRTGRLCRRADALAISRQSGVARATVASAAVVVAATTTTVVAAEQQRWCIRETRGASAGVAMTQSQRGPMDWLLYGRCSVGHDWAWLEPEGASGVPTADAERRVGECQSVPRGVISYR